MDDGVVNGVDWLFRVLLLQKRFRRFLSKVMIKRSVKVITAAMITTTGSIMIFGGGGGGGGGGGDGVSCVNCRETEITWI